jgi:hypothetical protein
MDITLPAPAKPTDISNTLSTIYNIRNRQEDNALARQRFQSDEKSKNALAVHNANVEKRQAEADARANAKTDLEKHEKSISWIAALPTPQLKETAYADYVESLLTAKKASPLSFPPATAFKTPEGVWDDERFNNWAKSTHYALTSTIDAKEGTRIKQVIINPKFNPQGPESVDNPKLIEVHTVIKDGKQTMDADAPATPVVDPFAKLDEEERYKKEGRALQERDTIAREKRAAKAGSGGGGGGGKPEIKPMAALSKSRQLLALKDKIVNGGKIDPIMAMLANRPELAGMDVGAVKDQASRDSLLNSIETEYNEVQKFVDPKLRSTFKSAPAAPALKPITDAVIKEIKGKAKTRAEAEQMALDKGFDPTVKAK